MRCRLRSDPPSPPAVQRNLGCTRLLAANYNAPPSPPPLLPGDIAGVADDCLYKLLVEGTCEKCSLDGFMLDGVNLEETQMRRCSFVGASLRVRSSRSSPMHHPSGGVSSSALTAHHASLQGARLDRTSLTDVDFSGADISTASFQAATLTRVTMRGARAMQAGGDMSPR